MKRLLKGFYTGCLILLTIYLNTMAVSASDKSVTADDLFGFDISQAIPDETAELLELLDIDTVDFDAIFNVKAEDCVTVAKKLLTGGLESPFKSLVRLIVIITLIAIFESFLPDDAGYRLTVEVVASLLCTLSVIEPLSTAITSAVASISVSETFMLTLIPLLTAIVSLSGNSTLALSFQSIAFAAAQIISGIAESVIVPIVGAVLALDVTASVMPTFSLSGLTDFIKKTITSVLSIGASVFMSFLGIKGVLANAADTVAGKGIKMIISSAVPVVGGALSEAYSGIMGSIVIVRSTVGIIGICIIALINLPSLIQLLFWIFALRFAAASADLFEQKAISAFLRALASSLTLLNVVLLFVAVLFILSTALLISLRTG